MADFALRPATAQDAAAIRKLIHLVGINPLDLNWRHFVVAVDDSGRMRACGQLKPHGGQVLELASIAVEPASRGRGMARALIEHLIASAPRPLYLTCLSGLESFYAKWGFRSVAGAELPAYFRNLLRLARAWGGFAPGERLLVMKLM